MLSDFEPETFYHVFNHAVVSENLFRAEKNYLYFLKKIVFYLPPVCKAYAYCLLPNHFHLLIKFHDEQTLLNFQEQNAKNMIFIK